MTFSTAVVWDTISSWRQHAATVTKGGRQRKRASVPRVSLSYHFVELRQSCWQAPTAVEETLGASTPWKKKTKCRCSRQPSPPNPFTSLQGWSILMFFIKDRQQVFFWCQWATQRGRLFTTHLPLINLGPMLRTNGYWAPSIGICASICILSSSKRASSSWAGIRLKSVCLSSQFCE